MLEKNQENQKLQVIELINKEKDMNTSRMNRLEELGRVDSEKAYTKKGKRNLKDEKKRVVGELKMKKGGKIDGCAIKGHTRGRMV